MENFEIERRFLLFPCSVKSFLKKNSFEYKKESISQFYLKAGEGEVVRYRKIGNRFVKTVKKGEGLVREEYEEEIKKKEFLRALKEKEGRLIRKNRYYLSLENRIFEFDEFKGYLKDLNILEIEFESEEKANSFSLPKKIKKIVIDEITSIRDFSNKALSKRSSIPSLKIDFEKLIQEAKNDNHLKASLNLYYNPYDDLKDILKVAVLSLVCSINSNRKLIIEGDKDSERLHQFRVAIRKLRSILKLFDFAFDKAFLKKQKKNLSLIMDYTNESRDIDVYLLKIKDYERILPSSLKDSIDILKNYLVNLKKRKDRDLKALLMSEFVKKSIKELEEFSVCENYSGFKRDFSMPSIVAAKRVLLNNVKSFLKKAKSIDLESDSKSYHEVRIEAKKIRYCAEFFSSILDEKPYKEMENAIKNIQTILGDHQDLEVQRSKLKEFLSLREFEDKKTKKALKYLRKFFKREKLRKRKEFLEILNSFKKEKKSFKKAICRY